MHTQFQIRDRRTTPYFKKTTFCGYKKIKVVDALNKSVLLGNIEKASLWATELHISGHTRPLFDTILSLYLKDINTANIQLLPVIYYDYMKIQNIKVKDMLYLRNNQYSRNHIHNLISYITFSPKKKLHKLPTIKPDDFNSQIMRNHMISSDRSMINQFISVYDHKDIIIPILEIYTNMIQKNNAKSLDNALYWLSWLCTYEKKFHKGYIRCHFRINSRIHEKEAYDFIWIIWNMFFSILEKDTSPQSNVKKKYAKCLFNIFTKKYKHTQKTKKMSIIIMMLTIIIDPHPHINYSQHIITGKKNITRIKMLSNINYQYIDIQKNTPQHLYDIIAEQEKNVQKKKKQSEPSDSIFSNNKPDIPVNLDKIIEHIDKRNGYTTYKQIKQTKQTKQKNEYTQSTLHKHVIHVPQNKPDQSIFNRKTRSKKNFQKKHIHNFNSIFKYI